ncbi:MAG: hypothetical protein ACE5IL_04855 [Myxococcota bacterium]
MSTFRTADRARRVAFALLATGVLGACASPVPATLPLRSEERPSPPPLPDAVEKTAGRLAALVLADRRDSAAEKLDDLIEAERSRRHEHGVAPGVSDQARALFEAGAGRAAFLGWGRDALDSNVLDRRLQRLVSREIDSEPLAVARQRLQEDRRRKLGSLVNRITRPLFKLAIAATVNPFETGSAALSSLLVMRRFPEATVQERQALHAFQEFVDRHPDAPEAEDAVAQISRYRLQWRRHEHSEALAVAERALRLGREDAALAHLDRADRLLPGDPRTNRLRERAQARAEARRERVRRALSVQPADASALGPEATRELADLARATLAAPLPVLAESARKWRQRDPAGALADEATFVEALATANRGDETAFFEALSRLDRADPSQSNMARHAAWILRDPEQNPYRVLTRARRNDRGRRLRWILLGSRSRGARRYNLPRPLEWIVDLPGFASQLATFPLRIAQYPVQRARFGGGVLSAGERYLAHFPHGRYAEPVHRELEGLWAQRKQWSRALEHQEARKDRSARKVAHYRSLIALRTLEAARGERRVDVRAELYRSVVVHYGDTPSAETARSELRDLIASWTPQKIRLSRAFLEEVPELWAPGALSLQAALFDGEKANGEMADDGITLTGGSRIRVALVDAKPKSLDVPPEDFARFVARLEEHTYERILGDDRVHAVHDPQRDLFFERARLGLLDRSDLRATATSSAEFLGTTEQFGLIRRRPSPLPVELVLQGDLSDFGFAAFPRLKLPRSSSDAYLYR